MANQLVTIGVTAYNAEDTIDRALRSALAQDWKPIEVIVVDDCSSDTTAARVEKMATLHPNVRLVRHSENAGVASARNTIIREALGEFVAFFDDDDESVPNRITTQVNRIQGYERMLPSNVPVICHAARRQIYPDGSSRVEVTMGTQPSGPAPAGIAVVHRILMGQPAYDSYGSCATCSQMARLSTYRQVGGFDPAFRRCEDTDFCVRLGLLGAHFVGVAEPLVTQQMMVTSEKTLETQFDYFFALLQKHRRQFRTEADLQFALTWLTLKFQWLCGRKTAFATGLLRLGLRHPVSVLKRIVYALPMTTSRTSFKQLHQAAR